MKLFHLMLSLLSLAALVRAETSAECSAKNEPLTEEQLAQFGYVKKNPYSSTNFKVAPRRPAPPFHDAFAVVHEKFEKLSLSNYKGKWLVLFFYPFDFTFVCPTEIVSFSESIDDFRSLNTEVVGVSTDSHHTHLAWIRTPREEGGLGTMKIPLIADISKQISQDYGVLITDPKDDMYGAAIRGLFIIDPKGIIRSIQINDDMVGRSVDETMRTLKALQFADSHPHQVCPANWKPGSKTITADQEKKMEFFSEIYGKQEL